MILFAYAVLIFLVIRFSVTLFNFLSNPKLPRTVRRHQDLVSILIPARDEACSIIQLLQSIEDQDYQNYEVIILDDDSQDDTYAITNTFCLAHENFTIVKGKPLPTGWLGKNYACHQLSELAKGKYMLFVDADVILKKGLINSLIFRMEQGKLSLISLFTNQIMLSIGEKLTVPLMHFILLNLLPLRLVRLSANPAFSAASGQCMFFNQQNYIENHWHTQVKNQVVEDIEIMKRVKTEKYKAEALLANDLIYCRMYQNLEECLNGFSKNLLAGFGNNILILLIYLLLVIGGPVILYLNFSATLLILPLTLIFLSRIMISFLSGQPVLTNLILHPLQLIFLLLISIRSVQKHLFKTGTWKKRKISLT